MGDEGGTRNFMLSFFPLLSHPRPHDCPRGYFILPYAYPLTPKPLDGCACISVRPLRWYQLEIPDNEQSRSTTPANPSPLIINRSSELQQYPIKISVRRCVLYDHLCIIPYLSCLSILPITASLLYIHRLTRTTQALTPIYPDTTRSCPMIVLFSSREYLHPHPLLFLYPLILYGYKTRLNCR